MMKQRVLVPLLLSCALAACTSVDSLPIPAADVTQSAPAINADDASTATEDPTSTIDEEPTTPPTAEPEQESVTPTHPAEQLIASFTQPPQTNGDLLVLYGQVLDVNESPIPNAVVEIWQTDASGVYDHPNDPGTDGRDTTFQFFGLATTDAAGWYAFRTIVPGQYEPRPRHIHYKVKQGDSTLLTSQFYFSDDIAEVQGEDMFQAVGKSGDLLLLQLVQGDGLLIANGRIVVDTGIGAGSLPLTPSQAAGPYYPVVSLLTYDNDLVQLP